jgi:transposase
MPLTTGGAINDEGTPRRPTPEVAGCSWNDRPDAREIAGRMPWNAQEGLKRDPHVGDLYVFRGKRGNLIKCLWHDGLGLSLYAKRLDRGRFVWPTANGGPVAITPAQLAYLLEAIDWRNPQHTWRPASAG